MSKIIHSMIRVRELDVDEPQVVHARQQGRAKHLAVGRNAAHAHAAKTHAVVAALTADDS